MMASRFGKVMTTLFTTLCAPILVSIVVQELNSARGSAGSAPHPSPPAASAGPRDIIVSHGLGLNPAQARQEALRAALQQEIGSFTSTTSATTSDRAACESILCEPRGVIVRCENLPGYKKIEAGREWYYQEVSVEIARDALARRLGPPVESKDQITSCRH
jgi:hypothetical protein